MAPHTRRSALIAIPIFVVFIAVLLHAAIHRRTDVYRQIGERKLTATIFEPEASDAAEPRACLIMIHGGGWNAGHPGFFFPHCRYFASRGMVAISVSYRLASEPGVTPLECTADAQAAVRWVRENAERLNIDPQRIAVAGDSAGGHLAAACGMIPDLNDAPADAPSSQADAMVLFNPIIDTTEEGWPHWKLSEEAAAKRGMTVAQAERRISPMHHVRSDLPPTLLMHGTIDPTTPIVHSRRFARKMLEVGNYCELVELPDRKHAFILVGYSNNDDRTIVDAMRKVDRFLASLGYLEGEPTIEYGWTETVEPIDYR